jgi:anthranilate/para-aminobenzoate synthase component I
VVAVALSLPPDAMAIARALRGRPGLAALVSRPAGALRPEDARWSFVACDPDAASNDLVPPVPAPARGGNPPGWGGAPAGPGWIGVLPYEALRAAERDAWTRRPDERPEPVHARPSWRRYPAVVRVDHAEGTVCVEGETGEATARLARALSGAAEPSAGFELAVLAPDEPPEAHVERVRAALRLIAAGDLYQVNLARRIQLVLRGDMVALFESLLDAAPAPWGFFQDLGDSVVCAASPELALSVHGDTLRTCPIKGTRPRGRDAADDLRLARELDADPKERAELVMATDVHRNDLGAVAIAGSVHVTGEPRLVAGRTVWSRASEVLARRAPAANLEAIVRACLPAGSVTGAPKVRAMEVIARLEPWRRGAYTGVLGYVGRDGSLSLAMAIRTLEIGAGKDERPGVYFTGGGVVADSSPERELEETRWKAAQLDMLSGEKVREKLRR